MDVCVCVCVSGTTWVSRYQKKHSPTHTHEEEEGFAQATRSALSQQGWSNPIKPAYNQRWPDGWFKLTASAFNRLSISTPTVLVAVPTVMQNSLHPLSTFSITARHPTTSAQRTKESAMMFRIKLSWQLSPATISALNFCYEHATIQAPPSTANFR